MTLVQRKIRSKKLSVINTVQMKKFVCVITGHTLRNIYIDIYMKLSFNIAQRLSDFKNKMPIQQLWYILICMYLIVFDQMDLQFCKIKQVHSHSCLFPYSRGMPDHSSFELRLCQPCQHRFETHMVCLPWRYVQRRQDLPRCPI